jgi:hypothetical protein
MSYRSFILGLVAACGVPSALASDGLLTGEVDLGSNGTYTGYSSSDFTDYGTGLKKVRVYDLVCPGDSQRPSSGAVSVELPLGQCVSSKTGTLIQYDSSSECFPITAVSSGDGSSNSTLTYIETITLGTYQCFSSSSMSIVAMIKQYRSEYYIVSSDTEGVQTSYSLGTEAAAQAAGKTSGGVYSTCTLNPFALCAGGRPGPKSPLRSCFDFLCD